MFFIKVNEKCSRRKALYEEFINDWDDLNLHSKTLIFIGFLILITLSINIVINFFAYKISSLFISILLSIFGFLLSDAQKFNRNKYERKYRRSEDCTKEIEEYNFKHGNIIQILITVILIGISCVSIIIIDLTNNDELFSFFREMISISVGFLLGESK